MLTTVLFCVKPERERQREGKTDRQTDRWCFEPSQPLWTISGLTDRQAETETEIWGSVLLSTSFLSVRLQRSIDHTAVTFHSYCSGVVFHLRALPVKLLIAGTTPPRRRSCRCLFTNNIRAYDLMQILPPIKLAFLSKDAETPPLSEPRAILALV